MSCNRVFTLVAALLHLGNVEFEVSMAGYDSMYNQATIARAHPEEGGGGGRGHSVAGIGIGWHWYRMACDTSALASHSNASQDHDDLTWEIVGTGYAIESTN